jgi:hypothetical protein
MNSLNSLHRLLHRDVDRDVTMLLHGNVDVVVLR